MRNFEQPQIEDNGNLKNRKEDGKLSRRDFLKKVALFGAAVVLTPKELLAQQTKSPELSDDAGIEEISHFITRHREIVDYAKLWPKEIPVLFIGERHTVKADKEEIIKNLAVFKKLGMTHLAMEMLREEQQKIVDDYSAGKIDRGKVLEIFKQGWDKRPGIAEKYMELLDAAKSNGMRILAVDLYTDSSEYGTTEFFRKRNANWARIAESILQDKKSRILFYNGQSHSGYNKVHDSANEILERTGIKSSVVEFAGGEVAPSDVYFFVDKVAKAAQNLEIGREKFSLRIKSDDDVRGMDVVIHLPQIEKSNS